VLRKHPVTEKLGTNFKERESSKVLGNPPVVELVVKKGGGDPTIPKVTGKGGASFWTKSKAHHTRVGQAEGGKSSH